MAAAIQEDRFAILRADEVSEGHTLRARDEIIFTGHEVQDRASNVLQVDDVLADRHAVLCQEILLVEIFDELAVDFARNGDVVIEPAFGGEKIFEEFLLVHVFVKIDRLFNKVSDRSKEQERRLKKFRRAIAESVDKFIHV